MKERTLLYVPVIHMEADLGTLAPTLEERSNRITGEQRWIRHKKTVADFWDAIADYLDPVEAQGLKIYQDGLVADGELGLKIVCSGAEMGSKNHQIILKLIQKGGELIRTEDIRLVKQEYEYLVRLAQSKSLLRKALAYLQHKLDKARLTQERDEFIAARIDDTLAEGERGILFLGAYHDVPPLLPKDMEVKELKEREKVSAYFAELIAGRDESEFDRLAAYLASPVALG